MHNPNGLRVVALLTPPLLLLLPLSILIAALERIAHALLTSHTARDFRSGASILTLAIANATASSGSSTIDVAVDVNQAPTLAILGICVLAFFVAVIGASGIWELRRVEGTARRQRVWAWAVVVASLVGVVASIGVLAWASAMQGEKGWQSSADVGRAGQGWTRETWVCQIAHWVPGQGWAGSACGLARATRWMLISLAVSCLLTILSTWVLVNERGGVKWLAGGRGRYGGFEDIYEMKPGYQQPQGPVVYQGYQGPQNTAPMAFR
ncbi:hypothetical protein K491DRAFT_602521 [Lophiostoma macrostomum CBS 122681]|uniref:MARVEL domain-containing protein n=1 Tax=Lophiostoma macrostomum CBS 122681 TaxID=1314788 RepID=A0A6A6T518_9PLEO|nr:hypothetical protein K491DRAFT_602521 [Lophiostoma macrostomum CBS 122681]